jgi:PIN domain nuclease of toxin-antitoxin system
MTNKTTHRRKKQALSATSKYENKRKAHATKLRSANKATSFCKRNNHIDVSELKIQGCQSCSSRFGRTLKSP